MKSKHSSYQKRWNAKDTNIERDKKTVREYLSSCMEYNEQHTFVDNTLLLACHYEFVYTCKMTHKVR